MKVSATVSLLTLLTGASARVGRYQRRQEATTTTSASSDATPTVTLDYTTIVPAAGNSSLGYYKFQNIRFAQAPVDDLRFSPPEWPLTESSINDGSLADSDVACSSTEDCLFMDIWVPASAFTSDTPLPVLVWTYGGGFTGGSKAENTPEGLFELSQDFIFVSYNYRLGLTGIANGPTYNHEGGTSNVGLWDVTQAFEWVRKYISSFGGNPDAVTAMGFSAGGSQVLFQMTRFGGRAEQLFQQAWVMSPGFVPGAGHETAEQFWLNVSSSCGCDGGSIDCMRSVDFDTLTSTASDVTSTYGYQFQPRVDGYFVADTYEASFYANHFNFSGPAVLSHEQHEANSQAYSGVDTDDDVEATLRAFFPGIQDRVVEEVLELYPADDYTSPGLRFADMKQHFDLTAHNLAATHALNNQTWNAMVALGSATHGTDQSYYFYSTYTLSSSSSGSTTGSDTTGNSTTGFPSSSNSTTGGGMGGSSSVNSTIAVMMQKYLISFVLTGDPNGMWSDEQLYWPLYNTSSVGAEMVFNDTFYIGDDDLANDQAKFWNKALWY